MTPVSRALPLSFTVSERTVTVAHMLGRGAWGFSMAALKWCMARSLLRLVMSLRVKGRCREAWILRHCRFASRLVAMSLGPRTIGKQRSRVALLSAAQTSKRLRSCGTDNSLATS